MRSRLQRMATFLWIMLLNGMLIVGQSTAEERLNVVFILADDLGWGELGCYGQEKIPTPNIDSLALAGMRFTQHYSGAPVCAPSRCVLMTGKHLGHAEIRGNQQARVRFPQFTEGQHPISADVVTLAQAFKQAGYATGAMGKWGLGPVGSTGDPNRKGFDLFAGYNCQAVAHSYFAKHVWINDQQRLINEKPIPGHKKKPDGEVKLEDYQGDVYASSVMIEQAESFIDNHRDQPFFLYLPFIEPHVAMHPPKEWVERFPASWDEEVYRGENGYLPHPRPRAGYAAMIAHLDDHVGRVLAKLRENKLDERTLIIFTSDNGTTHPGNGNKHFHVGGVDAEFFNSTAGLRGYKGSVYEGGLRVPMIARLPNVIPANTVSHVPGYFADWFPTLAEAAKLELPSGLDGISLWPAMAEGSNSLQRNPMIWVFPEYGGQVAVRIGDMKVVRRGLKTKRAEKWEVYDLSSDPNEANDLSAMKADVIASAIDILKQQVDVNETFPLTIPGVTESVATE